MRHRAWLKIRNVTPRDLQWRIVTERSPVGANNVEVECKSDLHEAIISTLSSKSYSSDLKATFLLGSTFMPHDSSLSMMMLPCGAVQILYMACDGWYAPEGLIIVGHWSPLVTKTLLGRVQPLWWISLWPTIVCGLQPAPSHLSGLPTAPSLIWNHCVQIIYFSQ